MYSSAMKTWKAFPFVSIHFGHIAQTMMTRDEIITHPLFETVKGHFILHYQNEVEGLMSSPFLTFDRQVDVALIDGGEFSGYADYTAILKMNPKIICLDDTHIIKTSLVLKHLLDSGEWKVVESGNDRNGWCVLERLR
jgi:hypothetical protein